MSGLVQIIHGYVAENVTWHIATLPTFYISMATIFLFPNLCLVRSLLGLEDDEDVETEQIGPNGIAKLCDDIEVSLAAVCVKNRV